jgi:membrane associated rhomboid family serine protease/Flp pilus assembly protein TadD
MANCIRCGRQLPGFTFGKKICQWCVQHEAQQRGELGDDAPQPVMRTPWVRRESSMGLTQILFGANVLVCLVTLAVIFKNGESPLSDFPGDVLVWGANVGPYTLSGQWWRLLTYMFLHGSLMHIAFNMWCLWDLGALCESLYGRWTFGAIYIITGIGAGLTSVAWNPHVLSVGASGAIFGLAGALISSFYLGEFSMPKAALSGTLRSLLFFAGFNLFFGQLVGGIDNACHIGGLITGLILGALVARLAPEHDKSLRRAAVFSVVAFVLVGSALGVQRWRGFPAGLARGGLAGTSPAQMIARLQKLVRDKPSFAPAHVALAKAYLSQGRIGEAEAELRRALELDPRNAEAHMFMGAAYLSQEQPKEAQDEFAKALSEEPDNAEAHVWLGTAFAAEQNPQSAIQEYQAALKLDPQAEGVYYKIGISQAQLKQYDDAITSYLKERQRSGDDDDLETALADAYQAKGMEQQAQEARNKAAQLKARETD